MGGSAAISLSLLSLDPERKVKCYNRYFVNGYVFHIEEYGHERKTYNNGCCNPFLGPHTKIKINI